MRERVRPTLLHGLRWEVFYPCPISMLVVFHAALNVELLPRPPSSVYEALRDRCISSQCSSFGASFTPAANKTSIATCAAVEGMAKGWRTSLGALQKDSNQGSSLDAFDNRYHVLARHRVAGMNAT